MPDKGTKKTEKEIKKVEKNLEEIYSEAEKDIQDKLTTFMSKYSAKNQIKLDKLSAGEITQEEYNNWVQGQIFQKKQWQNKHDQIIGVMTNTNKVAVNMVNGSMYGVFAFNSNYQAYQIEKGFGINFGFGLYDTSTVTNLIKNDPQILPKWKINEKKDYIWNSKKVNNAITQGIIQGESLDKITKRISTGLCAQNENLMKTFARTGMTQAQNAGRYQRQMDAKQLGINLVKEWMSTLDGRTRDSHRHMDGEKLKVGDKWHPQKFSNGCRYPGDPEGPPREVYNCRCTLVADLVDYPTEYERYDNIDGKPIKNMTYDEWATAKGGVGHTRTKYKKITPKTSTTTSKIDYSAFGGKDVYDIAKKYDYNYEKFLEYSSSEEYDTVKLKGSMKERKLWFKAAEAHASEIETSDIQQKTTKKSTTTKKSATSKVTNIEDAKPRTADYITDVTNTGISNYGTRVESEINKSLNAVASSMGISEAEAKQAIEDGLTKIINGSDFTMRIKASNLEKVLSSGSFKNQFETGKSGGCFNPSMRKNLENKMFNVPIDGIDDADRPVYGMFCPIYDTSSRTVKDYYANGAGSWYGDGVTVVLKKKNVINNATMTIGDSLDYKGRLVGTEVNNINFAGSFEGGFSGSYDGLTKIAKLGLNKSSTQEDVVNVVTDVAKSGDHYFEYQLHGKETHSADNIDCVIIEKMYADERYNKLIKKLEKKGIPYTIIDRFN